MRKILTLPINSSEKIQLLNLLYNLYYETALDIEDYAPYFYDLTHLVLDGMIPAKLEQLSDYEEDITELLPDLLKVCTECNSLMNTGYVIGDESEVYCSDECLRKHYTQDEYNKMFDDDIAYYTEWEL